MVGCSDDDKGANSNGDPPGDTNVPAELIATWTFQSATVNDVSIDDLSMILPWEQNTEYARISINDDNTYVFENVSADSAVLLSETGAFLVDGSSFSLTGIEELSISGNWAVSGDSLTLTATEMGFTTVLTATK
jgi:hypothetical protein